MSIKLTSKIAGKEIELDLISLKGKTVIRNSSYAEAKKKGITKKALKEAGYLVESDVLKTMTGK